jgi:hypothetical protein
VHSQAARLLTDRRSSELMPCVSGPLGVDAGSDQDIALEVHQAS